MQVLIFSRCSAFLKRTEPLPRVVLNDEKMPVYMLREPGPAPAGYPISVVPRSRGVRTHVPFTGFVNLKYNDAKVHSDVGMVRKFRPSRRPLPPPPAPPSPTSKKIKTRLDVTSLFTV